MGGNLYLTEDTTIKARTGVYGSIIDADMTGTLGGAHTFYNDLTVNSSVYVRGDVNVDKLVVNGHLEANNYHVENGVEVYSDNTLIASGDLYIHHGDLIIGKAGEPGVVTVYGDLTIDNGNLNVVNGTLNLANATDVDIDGNMTVGVVGGTTGTVKQTGGIIRDMSVDGNVTINKGSVSIPGTIVDADTVEVKKDGVLTVTVKPVNYVDASEGKLNANGTGTPDEETPVTSGLELSTVTVKGVSVALDHDKHTGTVTLGYTDGQSLTETDVKAEAADGITVGKPVVSGDATKGWNVAITLKDTVTSGSTTTEVSTTYTITVTVREKSNDTSVASVKIKGETATASASDATKYTVDLTYAQATATDVRRAEITPNNNATLNNSINGAGMTNGDGANIAALEGVGDGTKDVTLTITFIITAEDGTTKEDYTVTVNVAKKPAQAAKVTLTDNGTEGVKLVPSGDDAYELIVRGEASNVDVTKLNSWVKAEGVGSAAITADNTEKKDNVFTITFKGVDGGGDQPVTVTVRTATADERAQWDLEAIKAAFPDNGYATIGTVEVPDDSKALETLKKVIEDMAEWNSNPTVTVNFVAGNGYEGREESAQVNISVRADRQSYTANVTVNFAPGT